MRDYPLTQQGDDFTWLGPSPDGRYDLWMNHRSTDWVAVSSARSRCWVNRGVGARGGLRGDVDRPFGGYIEVQGDLALRLVAIGEARARARGISP